MKRLVCYGLILAAALAWPVQRLDVAKLRPVQVIALDWDGTTVRIRTDTEDLGVGATPGEALANLEDTTPGVIYIDTAAYVLVTREAESALEALRQKLKPGVEVCMTEGEIDLEQAAAFLRSKPRLPRLKNWKSGQDLPILTCTLGRYNFLKKVENNA